MPFDYVIDDVDSGALTTSFDLSLVRSNEQLRRSLGFDASIEASFLFAKVSASYAFNSESTYSSSSVTIVVNATSELSRRQIRITKLHDDAVKLLTDRPAFTDRFGTRYVAAERRGARVSAILRFSNMTSTQSETVRASFAGGGWGVSAKAATNSLMGNTKGETTLTVDVYATGGQGFGPLAGNLLKITAPENIDAVLTALATALSTFPAETGAPLGFYTQSLGDIGLAAATDPWTAQRADLQRQVASKYRRASARLDAIRAISSRQDPRWQLLPVSYRRKLDETVEPLQQTLATLVGWYTKIKGPEELPADLAQKVEEHVVPGNDNLISTVDRPLLEPRACVLLLDHPGNAGRAGVTILDRLASEVVLAADEGKRKTLGAKLVYQMYDKPFASGDSYEVIECFVSTGQLLRSIDLNDATGGIPQPNWSDVVSDFRLSERAIVFLTGNEDAIRRWLSAIKNTVEVAENAADAIPLNSVPSDPGRMLVVVASPTPFQLTNSTIELINWERPAPPSTSSLPLTWTVTDVFGNKSLTLKFGYVAR